MNIKPEQIPAEVVEAAYKELLKAANDPVERQKAMRHALAAALPVLLGEPVGWQRRYGTVGIVWSSWHDWPNPEFPSKSGRWVNEYRPLYTLPTQDTPNADQ